MVQVEVWAKLGSGNFLIYRRKLNRVKEEVRRKKEGKMAETTEIGVTGEGTMMSATVGDPARTTTDVIKKRGRPRKEAVGKVDDAKIDSYFLRAGVRGVEKEKASKIQVFASRNRVVHSPGGRTEARDENENITDKEWGSFNEKGVIPMRSSNLSELTREENKDETETVDWENETKDMEWLGDVKKRRGWSTEMKQLISKSEDRLRAFWNEEAEKNKKGDDACVMQVWKYEQNYRGVGG